MIDDGQLKARKRREDCPFPMADDRDVIGPVLDDLEADDRVRRLAVEIAAVAESTMWVVGKRRSTVAATAVYVAGKTLGEATPVYTQAEVAEASDAAKTSIINHHEDLQALFEAVSISD